MRRLGRSRASDALRSRTHAFVVYGRCFGYIQCIQTPLVLTLYTPSLMVAISELPDSLLRIARLLSVALLLGCAEDAPPAQPSKSAAPMERVLSDEERGDQLVRAGRYGEAVQAYRRASRELSATAELYRKLAQAHALNQELPAAVRVYEQAIDRQADFAKARTELAVLLTRLDRPADALEQLERAVRDRPDYAWAHMVLGLMRFRQGDYEAAIAAQRRAIAAVPDYAEAWFNLGEVYLKQNAYAEAEEAFRRAVASDSTAARFHNGLGRSYYQRRDYATAALAFERAVQLDSLFARARFNLGNSRLRMGDKDEGRRQLALYRALEEQENRISILLNTLMTYPDSATVYHDLAIMYSQRGQWAEAHARYLQAIARDASFAPSYHNLGNLYMRNGALDQAERLFQQALRADSTYVLAHLALGNAQMLQKRFDRAMASFRSGLRYDPQNATLRRNLAVAQDIAAQARGER